MGTKLLTVDHLSKYFGKNKVLDQVRFEIDQREIFGIMGASGSGKTTLLKTIVGFYQPDHGEVFFNIMGKYLPVSKFANNIKQYIGFAAQEPSFYPKLTVCENLHFIGKLYGLSSAVIQSNEKVLLSLVELENARDIMGENLSGGMQRRLDIACSLIHDPLLLILDEPTADLDPVLSAHIWELIKKINKKGTSILVASHDLQDLEKICQRVGILMKKKILHISSVEEMMSKYRVQKIYLESYPGKYKSIAKHLTHKAVQNKEIKGHQLVVSTNKIEPVLHQLLKAMSQEKETLTDMHIQKLTLDDVFKNYTGQ